MAPTLSHQGCSTADQGPGLGPSYLQSGLGGTGIAHHGNSRANVNNVLARNNYRARDFTRTVKALASRHQRIRAYTPRHNGKVERYNRLLVDEVLYTRTYTSEHARRTAVAVWVNHYNYHRPHTACGDQPRPHAPRTVSTTSRPLTVRGPKEKPPYIAIFLKPEVSKS